MVICCVEVWPGSASLMKGGRYQLHIRAFGCISAAHFGCITLHRAATDALLVAARLAHRPKTQPLRPTLFWPLFFQHAGPCTPSAWPCRDSMRSCLRSSSGRPSCCRAAVHRQSRARPDLTYARPSHRGSHWAVECRSTREHRPQHPPREPPLEFFLFYKKINKCRRKAWKQSEAVHPKRDKGKADKAMVLSL